MSEFHAEAPEATASEGLAQVVYVAARAVFEPTILQSKGIDSTTPPQQRIHELYSVVNHKII